MSNVLALVVALATVTCVSSSTLKQVVIITRHGARSPLQPFPNDNPTEVWKQLGSGQLTTLGMQQMYQLGEYIRKRYSNFIDKQYNRSQVNIRSTDLDRALESAQIMLAALYPPSGDQIWNNNINWQPIPVHTMPRDKDELLDMDIPPCPRYDQILDETRQTKWYKTVNDSYKEIYEILKYHSGVEGDFDPIKAWDVWDTLYCYNNHGIDLPAWATEDIMTRVPQEIVPFEYQVEFGSVEKNRLKGGPMVHEILSNFHNLRMDSRKKMFLFSAHDGNVINQLIAYGNFEWYMIPYASALFVELLETEPSQYVVHLAFRNSTTQDVAITLTLAGCTDPCPLEMFTDLMAPHRLRPEDRETACNIKIDLS